MDKINEAGVGYCIGADHETDLMKNTLDLATIKIESVGRNEIAVKEENGRPYRAEIRPRLSA
jgi:hypothetical protein